MDAGLGLLKWRPLLAGECCLGVWFLVYAGKVFEFESECGLCILGWFLELGLVTLFMERINLVGLIVCDQGRGEDDEFVWWEQGVCDLVYDYEANVFCILGALYGAYEDNALFALSFWYFWGNGFDQIGGVVSCYKLWGLYRLWVVPPHDWIGSLKIFLNLSPSKQIFGHEINERN